jgi:hypothetical protein
MPNLITLSDIRNYWPISLNIDDNRVDTHIHRAEQRALQPLISPTLFYALKQAIIVSGDRFDKLLNGEAYTDSSTGYPMMYPGLKELLCAYAYAYIVDGNPVHITRGGNTKKNTEQSENVPEKSTSLKSQDAYSEAIRLEGEFYKWILVRGGDYPEYGIGRPSKPLGFNFFNASRNLPTRSYPSGGAPFIPPPSVPTNIIVYCGEIDISLGSITDVAVGSGTAGAILLGNEFDVSVGGTISGWANPIPTGATIRAKIDNPGNTEANWRVYY